MEIRGIKMQFDKTNKNCLLFFKESKLIYMLALPPVKKGCDVINLSPFLSNGYTFNFEGFILITTEKYRKVFYKGDLALQIKR
jgi:hypothetical protein